MPGILTNGREWRWDAKYVRHTGEAALHSSLLSPGNTIPTAGRNKQDVPSRHYKRVASHKTDAINDNTTVAGTTENLRSDTQGTTDEYIRSSIILYYT